LVGILLEDVDKRNRRIFIRSGKGAKERIVHMDSSTTRAIWRYLAGRGARAAAWPSRTSPASGRGSWSRSRKPSTGA
jgi:site-specific recombinase XerD